ncbi:polar amino acid transport system permease protein [Pilibacter termitis]|uniref:Polar amino acid transport system permease protein n=1 Tax=Pilibacter termitis TaxID=263852 RepID=A0A1T4KLR5_9ENTE|nr:amino acid ABC transporter permease [Pilibacter termitis]SJZ43328.1 polar amino acid transport system permease protein [Pilibacter termitis]
MNYIVEILPALLSGAMMTVKVFVVTLIGAMPLGILVAFGLLSRFRIVRYVLNTYVWIMRGTPLLLQLIFVFYGLPLLNGIVFERYDAAIVAFVLNYAAYFAEIFRGGIQSVPDGQREAARVLGLNQVQTITKIVLPQVIKVVLPSIVNEVVTLVKDSSLIYVIGLGDLLRAGQIAMNRDVSILPMIFVGLIYLFIIGILTLVAKRVEKYFSYYK